MPSKIATIMQNAANLKHAISVAIDHKVPWLLDATTSDLRAAEVQMVRSTAFNHHVWPFSRACPRWIRLKVAQSLGD